MAVFSLRAEKANKRHRIIPVSYTHLLFAHEEIKKIVEFIEEIVREVGRPKQEVVLYKPLDEIDQAVREYAAPKMKEMCIRDRVMALGAYLDSSGRGAESSSIILPMMYILPSFACLRAFSSIRCV